MSTPHEPGAETSGHAAAPRVVLALVAVQVVFASWAIVGKVTVGVVAPFALVFARLAGGALFFALAAALLEGPRALLPPREARRGVLRLALTGLVLNQALFTAGLALTSAIEAALLTATIPLCTVLFAVLSRREPALPRRAWAGLVCALVGVVAVARPERLSLREALAHAAGNAMILANAASYAAYLVWARELLPRYGPRRLLGWMFLYAAALFAPLGLAPLAHALPGLAPRAALAVGYVLVGPTLFAYGANAWALRRAPASLVALFVYLQPLLAVLFAVAFGDRLARWLGVAPPGERFSARLALGGALVLAGVALATRRRAGAASPQRQPQEPSRVAAVDLAQHGPR